MSDEQPASQMPAGLRSEGRAQQTLADIIKQRGPLPEVEIVAVFTEVLNDLELAHSQAMIHRDITTARVVRERGAFKLTDYGVSRIGTVRYMSPERGQGKPLDCRSDTYSLGVVLFEAATGKLPFDGELNHQIIDAQIHKPPPSPRSIRPDLTHDLERIILRALSKNPAGRFQTAAEFRQALKNLKAQPAAAPPAEEETMPEPGTVMSREVNVPRRRSPAVVLVPVLVVVVVGVAALLLTSGVLKAGSQVPRLVGLGQSDAEATLRASGFTAMAAEVDDTVPAGRVAAQSPGPGARLHRGGEVKLSVSTGLVAVPELAGVTAAEAGARLARAGLAKGNVDSQYSDSYPVGVVAQTTPSAGERVKVGSAVAVVVAAGRATCPQCGAKREPGASFCVKCGYKF